MAATVEQLLQAHRRKQQEADESFATAIGYWVTFLAFVASLILVPILRGWVIAQLWRWFIVSTFHIAPLTTLQAIGVAFTVACVVPASSSSGAARDKSKSAAHYLWTVMLTGMLVPLFMLGTGWIVHLFY